MFLGGPLPGLPLPIGHLLCAPPVLEPSKGVAGVHSIPIPNDAALVGQTFCTQAATVSFGPLELVLQNALDITIGGAGADTVTVLVVADDEDDTTPPLPVPGARVTLRGTDAGSAGGAAGTTDANGEVVFPLVSGPYDVTAQLDVDKGGTITRHASSVLGVDPVSGTIGVLLLLDDTEPDVDATLEGTVAGLALSGSEFVEVLVRGHGPVDFEESAFVEP